MGPDQPLPFPLGYDDDEAYIHDLLEFVTQSELLKTLVSGVHILDFFVSEPDLYEAIMDAQWRQWFELVDIHTFVDFCTRADLESPLNGLPLPPQSLVDYLSHLRRLTLARSFQSRGPYDQMPPSVGMGMSAKKIHEVDHFARYVHRLAGDWATATGGPGLGRLVDFGAGQGYLDRFMASAPWHWQVVALEGKAHNVENARMLDRTARITGRPTTMCNKKAYRAKMRAEMAANGGVKPPKPRVADQVPQPMRIPRQGVAVERREPVFSAVESPPEGHGAVQHVEYRLEDGQLASVVRGLEERGADVAQQGLLVMSLHSCGQLSHHALRSLVDNPEVRAVAVVGCCYNLMAERLGPPSYKMPSLRPEKEATEADPNGFPMSQRLCDLETDEGRGLRIPMTARMMAVQAPANWGREESDGFFTRHFFRALLQKVMLDRGLVERPNKDEGPTVVGGRSPAGGGSSTQPVIIGKLGKSAYRNFPGYVAAAANKLAAMGDERGQMLAAGIRSVSHDECAAYAEAYKGRKKQLSVVWTLMAVSAQLVEATVIVDRYLYLKEQPAVARCWVEPVFDYAQSPRNLAIVGIKK